MGLDSVVENNVVWTGFTVLLGFLVAFRTSQAYDRFLEGARNTHQMRVEWFDACSALIAFSRHNKKDHKKVADFQGLIVRLFSMLHAAALAEIEDSNSSRLEEIKAFQYDLLDVSAIDSKSLESIRVSNTKPELLYHWINQIVVEEVSSGLLTIPSPILTRFFQNLSNGMINFHEVVQISSVPFPFPYAQTCDWLLIMHCMLTPVVISQWVTTIGWSAAFAFLQVFIVWSLNGGIAQEIENPFGQDANDLNLLHMQKEMNEFLLMLLDTDAMRLPRLIEQQYSSQTGGQTTPCQTLKTNGISFIEAWSSHANIQGDEGDDISIACSIRGSPSESWALDGPRSQSRSRFRKAVKKLTAVTALTNLGTGGQLAGTLPRASQRFNGAERRGSCSASPRADYYGSAADYYGSAGNEDLLSGPILENSTEEKMQSTPLDSDILFFSSSVAGTNSDLTPKVVQFGSRAHDDKTNPISPSRQLEDVLNQLKMEREIRTPRTPCDRRQFKMR